MSTFIDQVHLELSSQLVPPPSSELRDSDSDSELDATTKSIQAQDDNPQLKHTLREYFLNLDPPLTRKASIECLRAIENLQKHGAFAASDSLHTEEQALEAVIMAKMAAGLYLQSLELYLNEAREADKELEWWADIERSKWYTAYYLLQTLPIRIYSLSQTILDALRAQRLPLRLSTLKPSSIRQLFPSRSILQPDTLTIALFPHLHHQPYPASFFTNHNRHIKLPVYPQGLLRTIYRKLTSLLTILHNKLWAFITFPLSLTRHECQFKRQQLEKIRDERASVLGKLLDMRSAAVSCTEARTAQASSVGLQNFAERLQNAMQNPVSPIHAVKVSSMQDAVGFFDVVINQSIPNHVSLHEREMKGFNLRRPSRLTLIWPQLVLLPPLALYGIRTAYASRADLEQLARDAVETLKHFWQDWLLTPLHDVVKTVRAGSNDGVIITHESVKADLDSLERMTLSLAQDKLHYTPEQMAALSQQIRLGDLTAVMQIYEDDIRSPLKSAVGGTLLRTLLVQVQKAKVDIDQALSGIDKLLKSQELTFAFVGVAPALAITYGVVGYLRALYSGGRGRGRYGGKRHRVAAWIVMRRIERLLITNHPPPTTSATIEPRVTGLLLLATTQLRHYAENHLPTNSRIRSGFLEDVMALEDSTLGREDKLRVVDRMWNSWGDVLDWRRIGAA